MQNHNLLNESKTTTHFAKLLPVLTEEKKRGNFFKRRIIMPFSYSDALIENTAFFPRRTRDTLATTFDIMRPNSYNMFGFNPLRTGTNRTISTLMCRDSTSNEVATNRHRFITFEGRKRVEKPVELDDFGNIIKQQKEVFEDSIDEDLRVIEASGELQVQKALEWAQFNVHLLTQKAVRMSLENLLLQFDCVEKAFRESPANLIALVNAFIRNNFDYHGQFIKQERHKDAFLWTARMSHFLRDHIESEALTLNLSE